MKRVFAVAAILAFALAVSCGCAGGAASSATDSVSAQSSASGFQVASSGQAQADSSESPAASTVNDVMLSQSASNSVAASSKSVESPEKRAKAILDKLQVTRDFRDSFVHGEKGPKYQKYIVLHDTETGGTPIDVVNSWDGSDRAVAAHFVVGRDGSVAQCVRLDDIAHHAGFGDTGHNEEFGVEDESRDDKVGTSPIGDWAADYGMNSYSVGIEMVHIGGEEDYTEEQLETLDAVIAAIDAYYGKESKIIDHKAWRSGNSDTSEEFAEYFENYQGKNRTHDGKPFDVEAFLA